MSVSLAPFQLSVAPEILTDLDARLERTRWPALDEKSGWADGCDPRQLRAFVDFWRRDFVWRAFETRVNRWPQFLATIDDCEIHCLCLGPRDATPLLMLHGWPGSFVELLACAERLAKPANGEPAFAVVLPSLPGFGFSRRPRPGAMSLHRAADVFAQLMHALGHERFFVQGGDFGAGVGSALALRHPARVRGLHLNYIPGSYRPALPADAELRPEETAFLAAAEKWFADEGAYAHVQRTRPLALAIGLHDSPAGLAAWILEKFAAWADCDGDLARLPAETLAANLTLYWVSDCFASSIEWYRDVRRAPFHLAAGESINVPCAIARFPREAPFPPRAWIERGYRIVRWTDLPAGGHFAALEQPDLLARDVRAFVAEELRE